jgi:ELWxxDGT repeat protein
MQGASKKSWFLLAAVLAFTVMPPAGAQTATLVADIHPGPPAPGDAPAPQTFMPIPGGSAFFLPGATPDPAQILWVTDGTAAGTRSLGTFLFPRFFGTLPGLTFFLAGSPDETGSAYILWRMDGTEAGTFRLSPSGGDFRSLTPVVVGGRLLASYCLPLTNDCGLYATDGSAAGTVRLTSGIISELARIHGIVYFFGGTERFGLWRTDGTPAGTRIVRSLRGGWTRLLTASGSRLFYMSGDDSGELWTSDGTPRGTRLVRTFDESDHDFIGRITTFLQSTGDGQVTFVAERGSSLQPDLWRSDGTPHGTVRLTHFEENSGVKNLRADQIAVLGRRTLFVADNGISGSRLWSTRGSLETTAPFEGCPGDCPELLAGTPLVPLEDRVIFAARDLDHGAELWMSDGTPAGTRLLADLCPGPCDANPADFTAAAGKIWFRVTVDGVDHLARTDGTPAGTALLTAIPAAVLGATQLDLSTDGRRVFFAGMDALDGAQPWATDGTPAGTSRVSVLPAPAASSEPASFTALGDRLLFTAWDGTQTALWMAGAAGTGASIVPGTAVAGKSGPAEVTVAGGRAFFVQDRGDGSAAQLWRTDGTAAGTVDVADFPDRTLSDLHDFGARLLFLATPTGDAERHIPSAWASDGTAEGTIQLFALPDDTLGVAGLTPVGAEIYLEVDREAQEDIYRSDGTAEGTRRILSVDCCSGYPPPRFVRLGDAVYFTAFSDFYRTDGTAAGTSTVLAPDADGNPPIANPGFPFVLGGRLFVFAGSSEDGDNLRLLRIDGDQQSLVAAVGTAQVGEDPQITPLGDAVFFRGWDPDHGNELWRTEGTPEGTALVTDLVPGPGSSDPQGLTAAGGRLYFTAWDELHGRELWASDGTAAGTRLVDDIAPGAFSSAPMLLTPVAGRLFFTADDGLVGREPWSLPLPAFSR